MGLFLGTPAYFFRGSDFVSQFIDLMFSEVMNKVQRKYVIVILKNNCTDLFLLAISSCQKDRDFMKGKNFVIPKYLICSLCPHPLGGGVPLLYQVLLSACLVTK